MALLLGYRQKVSSGLMVHHTPMSLTSCIPLGTFDHLTSSQEKEGAQGNKTFRERDRPYLHNFHCSVLLFWSVFVIVVNLLLCLICRLDFITGMYAQAKTANVGAGTVCSFRQPPVGLGMSLPRIKGNWCTGSSQKSFFA